MSIRYKGFHSGTLNAMTVTMVMENASRRVLRNTYMLLAMCLGVSALMAGTAFALRLLHPGILLTLVGYYGLYF